MPSADRGARPRGRGLSQVMLLGQLAHPQPPVGLAQAPTGPRDVGRDGAAGNCRTPRRLRRVVTVVVTDPDRLRARNDESPTYAGLSRCAEEDSNLHPVIPDQALNLVHPSVLCVQIVPNRPIRPAIRTHRTHWTGWMLSRMLSRIASASAWPLGLGIANSPARSDALGSSRIRLRPVWPCARSRAQSCREDQSSAAKRIETVLTTSPTIQPATS